MDHPNRVEDMDGEVFPQLVGDFPEESKTKGQKEHLNPHSVVEKLDDGAVSILKDMFVAKSDRKDSTDTTFNPVKLEEKHSPVEKQDIFDGAVSSSFSSLAEEDANTRTLPDEETFLSYRNPALNKISVPSSLESDHSDDMNMFENAKGYEEEFEYKYHRVFSDFKHYRMQKELEVDTLEDRHAAEIKSMKLEISAMNISHETIIAEKDRSIKELHCQLTQYLNENDPIKKLADMSIELEKAKEEIEILRVQNQVANEIKDYLNQKWIEQERVVDGVQQLMRKVSAQKRR